MSDRRDTVVVKDGNSGSSAVIGVIILILALVIGWYLFLGPGADSSAQPGDVDVNIQLPSVAPTAS